MLRGEFERSEVTRRQQLRLATVMSSVNWTDGVNHMLREKIAGGGDYGLAGRQSLRILCPANFTARFQNRWPTGAVDGAVNAAPTQERGVGRVYDRVNVVSGDIADDNQHATAEKRG